MQFFRAGAGIGILAGAALLAAQAPQRTRVIGTLTEVSAAGASVKTDAGAVVVLSFGPDTRYQKVAPGEKDLTKAQTIAASELASGDRVLARGTASEDGKTLAAQSVIVMSGTDIARKREAERTAWIQRGMAGLAVSIDPAKNEIQLRIPSLFGQARTAVVALKDSTRFRRYAPDSVRFADAKPGTLADIQPGDQLRVLGDKNEDGTRITADEIVSGSFHTVAGPVTAIDPAAGELQHEGSPVGRTPDRESDAGFVAAALASIRQGLHGWRGSCAGESRRAGRQSCGPPSRRHARRRTGYAADARAPAARHFGRD